jgi:cobalt/nickel transport system permease protein
MIFSAQHHYHRAEPTLLHRLPAGWKMAFGLVIITGTVVAPLSWTGWFAGVSLFLAVALAISRIPLRFLGKRLLLLSPLIAGVAMASAFEPGRHASWLGVSLKSVLCLISVVIISNTSPFGELLKVLRMARVPSLLITTVALMHRYLSVLGTEAERMRRARLSRTFVRRRRVTWRSMATVISQLFVRSSERAERIYQAMCARGWQ